MLTETCSSPDDCVALNEICPSSFSYFHRSRLVHWGGSLAVFYKVNFKHLNMLNVTFY